MFLNIRAPEIVLGASLLSFFVLINFPRGLVSIFVAHVMFNVAFVAVTVRAPVGVPSRDRRRGRRPVRDTVAGRSGG